MLGGSVTYGPHKEENMVWGAFGLPVFLFFRPSNVQKSAVLWEQKGGGCSWKIQGLETR